MKNKIKPITEIPPISAETIREVFNELFNNRAPFENRRVKGWRGCMTNGMVDILANHCGDENCSSCNSVGQDFKDALKEEDDN